MYGILQSQETKFVYLSADRFYVAEEISPSDGFIAFYCITKYNQTFGS